MKKILTILAVGLIIGGATLSWLFLRNQPVQAPKNAASTASKKQEAIDPNKHGFFDVDFSQKMIVHNQQAIEMTQTILATSTNPTVRELATEIQTGQISAEEQYKSWLGEWNETYTNLSDFPQMDGHDMYPSYPGLVTATDISKLRSAKGTEADQLFISLMIKHHESAIQGSEISNDIQYGKLIDFKNKSFADYKNEIDRLKKLQKDIQ